MNIVIDTEGSLRKINSHFKIYGTDTDLRSIRDAIDSVLREGVVLGWVEVGSPASPKGKDIFPWEGKDGKLVKEWE